MKMLHYVLSGEEYGGSTSTAPKSGTEFEAITHVPNTLSPLPY